MPFSFQGPTLTQRGKNGIQVSIPSQFSSLEIDGFSIDNYSIYNINFQMGPVGVNLLPFMGMYFPMEFLTQGGTINIDPSNFPAFPLSPWNSGRTFVTLYTPGDDKPTQELVPYPLSIPASQGIIGPNNLASISAVFVNFTAQQTLTLGPFQTSLEPGGGLYLTQVSFYMGIPTANISPDITLKDIAGTTLKTWHVNTGTTNPYIINENFAPGFAGAINAGQSKWVLTFPATASSPGTSANLIAYLI